MRRPSWTLALITIAACSAQGTGPRAPGDGGADAALAARQDAWGPPPDEATEAYARGDADASPSRGAGSWDGGEAEPCATLDPFPAPLRSDEGLAAVGEGRLRWAARDGNELTAFTYRPESFEPTTGPILFVIHGAGRNAEGYLRAFREMLERHGALGLAPEWPDSLYPGSEDFNFGVGTEGRVRGGTYDASEWRDPSDYTMSEVEHLFESVRAALASARCDYRIYGHSAGGQFVHRFLTFRPDARVSHAVAANPGWYTLPSAGTGSDRNFYVPYGLQGSPPDPTRLRRLFGQRLTVLLGEDDTSEDDPSLRRNDQANAQGPHRFARGMFYFATGMREASSASLPFEWTLDTVPGVGHSNSRMAPAAEDHLFP